LLLQLETGVVAIVTSVAHCDRGESNHRAPMKSAEPSQTAAAPTDDVRPLDMNQIAHLEEARQANGVSVVADLTEPVGGGLMCFGGVGSWANQAMGLGMNGPVDDAELDRLIAFFESRGVEPRVVLCPFADESLIRGLADRRFVVLEFETVLVHEVSRIPLPPVPRDIEMVPLDPANEQHIQQYVAITAEGFAVQDVPLFARHARRAIEANRCVGFLARIDGQFVAAGKAELAKPCGALFGMATREGYRHRGCQRALMIARLRAAEQAGCQYVTIQSKPHLATGRNAMRLGFQVAYTKAVVVRPSPGLSRSP
jgi:GNAT superfamily N-acetyltransferase